MIYRLLTDVIVAAHFSFLIFVVAGGFFARRHSWLVIPHLLAASWAVYVEATPGLICPLTPLENTFALRAGASGYQGSFIEHYLAPIIYQEGLAQAGQWSLAAMVVVMNVVVYAWPRQREIVSRSPVRPRPGLMRLLWVGPLTVLVSIVAVLIVRIVAVALLHPPPEFTPLGWDSPIVLTAVFVTSAALVFVLVARLASNAIRTFRIIAAVVLLLSFLPDIAVGRSQTPGATWPDALALMAMHIAAWAVCVSMLTKLVAPNSIPDGAVDTSAR
jgi:hypothetical protein